MSKSRERWTADDMPDLTGKTVVVTGGNSGIGYEAALQLARKGARVVLACRNPTRAAEAIGALRAAAPAARVEAMDLDLASLASVRRFAESFLGRPGPLHLLINNAGLIASPRRTTADGFELQLGTNHLGHFALTGLLLERLLATGGARVVTLSSNAHRMGRIYFDDLQLERGYDRWKAYGQSKLANLLFTYELQRRLEAAGRKLLAVACHPGYASTNLFSLGSRMEGSRLVAAIVRLGNRLVAQSSAMGALPTLCAATAPDVRGGDYIGPDGFMELAGHPRKVQSNARSRNLEDAARLWTASEQLTGVRYEALVRAPAA